MSVSKVQETDASGLQHLELARLQGVTVCCFEFKICKTIC